MQKSTLFCFKESRIHVPYYVFNFIFNVESCTIIRRQIDYWDKFDQVGRIGIITLFEVYAILLEMLVVNNPAYMF